MPPRQVDAVERACGDAVALLEMNQYPPETHEIYRTEYNGLQLVDIGRIDASWGAGIIGTHNRMTLTVYPIGYTAKRKWPSHSTGRDVTYTVSIRGTVVSGDKQVTCVIESENLTIVAATANAAFTDLCTKCCENDVNPPAQTAAYFFGFSLPHVKRVVHAMPGYKQIVEYFSQRKEQPAASVHIESVSTVSDVRRVLPSSTEMLLCMRSTPGLALCSETGLERPVYPTPEGLYGESGVPAVDECAQYLSSFR